MEKLTREEKKAAVMRERQEGVLVLEDIHDPHNAAAVWRSCDAFGIQKVYLIFEKEKKFNPKQVGKVASASANKWLDFKTFNSTESCYEELKREGYTIYATILDKKAKDLMKIKFKGKKVAIVLGNEHRGLSEKAMKSADKLVYIPMRGMVQSLNLSVTAAIMMFELTRQRQGESMLLSDSERKEMEKKWRWK